MNQSSKPNVMGSNVHLKWRLAACKGFYSSNPISSKSSHCSKRPSYSAASKFCSCQSFTASSTLLSNVGALQKESIGNTHHQKMRRTWKQILFLPLTPFPLWQCDGKLQIVLDKIVAEPGWWHGDRFARRSWRFIDAYRQGLDGKWAAWAARKYYSHRVLPATLMVDIDNVTCT